MLQRGFFVLLGLAGILIVGLLIAKGVDPGRAAARGPAWKRRLIAAGLLLLGTIGVPWATGNGAASSDPKSQSAGAKATPANTPASQTSSLGDDPRWQRLTTIWREAGAIGRGLKGPYPFDRAGQARILKDLEQAASEIRALQHEGLLSEPEAALLLQDRQTLVQEVESKRPTELQNATCYEPVWFRPADLSYQNLAARLPMLRKLAESRTLRPEALGRILASIEDDLQILANQQEFRQLNPDERATAERVRRDVENQLRTIRQRGASVSAQPDEQRAWKRLVDAWREAGAIGGSGKTTTPQRDNVKAQLEGALRDARGLVDSGVISGPEFDLLGKEAERLIAGVYALPPNDPLVPLCYSPAFILPAQKSMEQIAARLALLRQLADSGNIHPAVLRKLLPPMEADLTVLQNETDLKALPPADRENAARLAADTEPILRELKAMAGEVRGE